MKSVSANIDVNEYAVKKVLLFASSCVQHGWNPDRSFLVSSFLRDSTSDASADIATILPGVFNTTSRSEGSIESRFVSSYFLPRIISISDTTSLFTGV